MLLAYKLLQIKKLRANSMDPDQTALMRRLVWIHAGRKAIMSVCRDTAHICKCFELYTVYKKSDIKGFIISNFYKFCFLFFLK
jgi:hypothetical protein